MSETVPDRWEALRCYVQSLAIKDAEAFAKEFGLMLPTAQRCLEYPELRSQRVTASWILQKMLALEKNMRSYNG